MGRHGLLNIGEICWRGDKLWGRGKEDGAITRDVPSPIMNLDEDALATRRLCSNRRDDSC